jgi:ATP:ADP antiporter, AAA family
MLGASSSGPGAGQSLAARLLRPFAKVEASEATSAALLTLTVFLLLLAYYLLKTAREPLILLHGGAEVKSYAAAGQSLLLIPVVRIYSALAHRFNRMKLVGGIYGFFALNLVLFAGAARANWSLGVPFYLWVGIFNVTVIAQFWSFANDVYDPEQGRRLFAVLGIGSSLGAVAGSAVAHRLAALGPEGLMGSAALVLCACIALLALVDRRESAKERGPNPRSEAPLFDQPILSFLLNDKYLLLIAGLTFLLNCVNSNGEYILDRTLLASLPVSASDPADAARFVAAFKASYFGWVNVVGVVLQLFVVSRILTRFGVRSALFILPAVAFLSYSVILIAPVLALIRVGKIAENSLDYSVQNTARQALFLVGTRPEKYVGKTLIDTFIVRVGDVFSAGVVWVAAQLALPTKAFALINLAFIVTWLCLLIGIAREHRRRSLSVDLAAPALSPP